MLTVSIILFVITLIFGWLGVFFFRAFVILGEVENCYSGPDPGTEEFGRALWFFFGAVLCLFGAIGTLAWYLLT